jgi:Mn2+/Fe2+ NRAMP family transporter
VRGTIRDRLGPGLLFAAAAVGVSHLVQSTRAGAEFGLSMAGLIILACLIKYPAFLFGAQYAAATGESLIAGYARSGRWLLVLFLAAIAIEGLTVVPAVSLVAAGMTLNLAGIETNEILATMLVIALCSVGLAAGRYRLLESVTKLLVVIFSLLTVVAAVAAVSAIEPAQSLARPFALNRENLFFAVAVAGWMPVGMGGSILLSLWVLARSSARSRALSITEASVDFNIGYIGTAALALCFLLMGTALLLGSGQELAAGSVGFAAQLIALFTETVGPWVRPVIGVAALAVMFSTVLTVIDGFARVYADVTTRLLLDASGASPATDRIYVVYMVFQAAVALLLLVFFLQSFGAFIDFVTTVGFIVAPVIALFNHRVMTSAAVPVAQQPARWLRTWSLAGIVVLTVLSVAFLVYRFT